MRFCSLWFETHHRERSPLAGKENPVRRPLNPMSEFGTTTMTMTLDWCEYQPLALISDDADVCGDSGHKLALSVYQVGPVRLGLSCLPQNPSVSLGQILSNQESDSVVQTITECLRAQTYPGMRSLSVDYSDGVITLRGEVTTYYHKQVAQESVRRIAGIVAIVNLVDVRVAKPVTGFSQSSNQRNVVDGTA